jgi:hypothetical protein
MNRRTSFTTVTRQLIRLAAVTIAFVELAPAEGVNTLVYDVSTRRLCRLEKQRPAAAPPAPPAAWQCPSGFEFDRRTDFFRAGSVVRLLVVNHKFLSAFTPDIQGQPIADDLPAIRGISDAEQARGEDPKATQQRAGGIELFFKLGDETPEKLLEQWLQQLQELHSEAVKAIEALPPDFETVVLGSAPSASDPLPTPSFRLRRMLAFASRLQSDTSKYTKPYRDVVVFIEHIDRTDLLIESIRQFNKHPDLAKAFQAVLAWQTFEAAAGTVKENLDTLIAQKPDIGKHPLVPRIRGYLTGGVQFNRLQKLAVQVIEFRTSVRSLNLALLNIFDNVNSAYQVSESPAPYELFLGQWQRGYTVEVKLRELPGFKLYGFSEGITAPAAKENTDSRNRMAEQEGDAAAKSTAGSKTAAAGKKSKDDNTARANNSGQGETDSKEDEGEEQPQGEIIDRFNFDVHRFYRANVVSGFVYSFLDNREYGVGQVRAVDDAGQPRATDGAPVYNRVPTVGESRRPQLHYLVGVNIYLKERDLWPGRLTAADYLTPGILIGYGVNEPFNFFLGPNWELRPGLNLGFGVHFGRERFLAPGTVPYIPGRPAGSETRLADAVTEPPTVQRGRQGFYLSAGFDLSVFNSIWGKLVGAGSGKPGGGQ